MPQQLQPLPTWQANESNSNCCFYFNFWRILCCSSVWSATLLCNFQFLCLCNFNAFLGKFLIFINATFGVNIFNRFMNEIGNISRSQKLLSIIKSKLSFKHLLCSNISHINYYHILNTNRPFGLIKCYHKDFMHQKAKRASCKANHKYKWEHLYVDLVTSRPLLNFCFSLFYHCINR